MANAGCFGGRGSESHREWRAKSWDDGDRLGVGVVWKELDEDRRQAR